MQKKKLILIGSSTGGPGHLEKILSSLNPDFTSRLVISQHIDSMFLPSMMKHLNSICELSVMAGEAKAEILPAKAVFTYKDLSELNFDKHRGLYLSPSIQLSPYQPSVNSMFSSAAKLTDEYDILACLLTGIGDDGATGMLALKKAGAHCVTESQESSIIYGMPKAAFELGASSEVLHLNEIIRKIQDF